MNQCVFGILGYLLKTVPVGTVVEIGSKRYDKFDLRSAVQFKKYIGYDLEPGIGVDTTNSGGIPDGCADVVICSSVIEHDPDPSLTIGLIRRIKKPSGIVIVTIPFNWPIHNYPYDYRRLTPDGLSILMREIGPVKTFGVGSKNSPHTVVGLIGKVLNDSDILTLNKLYFFEDGFVKGMLKEILPKFLFDIFNKVLSVIRKKK